MKNVDGVEVNTKREILLLLLRWLSSIQYKGKILFPFSVMEAENKINKIVNFFKNNALARKWIDIKYNLLGSPYPQFIFSDEPDDYDVYVASYKVYFKNWTIVMDVTTAQNSKGKSAGAMDFSRMSFLKKRILLKMINSRFGYRFRFRRLLEYPPK